MLAELQSSRLGKSKAVPNEQQVCVGLHTLSPTYGSVLGDRRGDGDVVLFVPFSHHIGRIQHGNDNQPRGVLVDEDAELLRPGPPRLEVTDRYLVQEEILFVQDLICGQEEMERGCSVVSVPELKTSMAP